MITKEVNHPRLLVTRHMLTHTSARPFACSECDYRTARKAHLTVHMRTHSNEKPFGCEYFSYKTFSKGQVTKHMQICKDRPSALRTVTHHVCEYCNLHRSTDRGHVTRQMKTCKHRPTALKNKKNDDVTFYEHNLLFYSSS